MKLSAATGITLMCFAGMLLAAEVAAQPTLEASDEVSNTGHFQLKWQSQTEEAEFILQRDQTPDFASAETIYRGPDRARTVSGMLDGAYYFRVRTPESDWSEPVTVRVEHYKLSTAFLFLGLGATVFLATAILVIRGHILHRKTFREQP